MRYFEIRSNFLIGLVFVLIGAAFFNGCGISDLGNEVFNNNYTARAEFSFTVDGQNKSHFRLEAINGPVEIVGAANTTSVHISGERRVGSECVEDARAHLDELVVNVTERGNEVFVQTVQPGETHGRSYTVSYQIRLPRHWSITVGHVNGAVAIDSTSGNIMLNLVNGDLVLRETAGNLDLGITNGQANCQTVLPKSGSIRIRTTNGAIYLGIPQTTSAQLSANVTNGNIRISRLALQNSINSRTNISGTLGQGEGNINLVTTNGNIDISGF